MTEMVFYAAIYDEKLSQKQTQVIFLDFMEKSLEKASKTMEVY